jgi:hypothetical protein
MLPAPLFNICDDLGKRRRELQSIRRWADGRDNG